MQNWQYMFDDVFGESRRAPTRSDVIMNRVLPHSETREMQVVLNWFEELRHLAPAKKEPLTILTFTKASSNSYSVPLLHKTLPASGPLATVSYVRNARYQKRQRSSCL